MLMVLMVMARLPRVKEMTGLGRSTIYKLVQEGNFPRPRQLTSAAVGWREDEVQEWLESRPAADVKVAAD